MRRSQRGAVALLLLVVLFAIGAGGWLLHRAGGLPERLDNYREKIALFDWREDLEENCSEELGLPRVCMMTAPGASVAVLGDSHSNNVYFALAHHYAGTDTGVLRLGRGGCPPLLGIATRRDGAPDVCRETVRRHIEYVARREEIHTVYLSSMPRYVLPGDLKFKVSAPDHPEMGSAREIFRLGLLATIERLQAAGKRVVLVMDWPNVTFDPRACVELRPFRFTGRVRAECSIPREQFLRSHAPMRQLQREVLQANPDLYYWDTAQAFCDETTCWVRKGDVMLYRDTNHLSLPGSRFLGERWHIQPAAEAASQRD